MFLGVFVVWVLQLAVAWLKWNGIWRTERICVQGGATLSRTVSL